VTNSGWEPTRLRYKLEGYNGGWQEGTASMCLTVRFADEHGDQVGQTTFEVRGESAGWNGTLTNSTLSHRRETLIAPPAAARMWVTISSGCGPPATVGLYVVDDLIVSKLSGNNGFSEVLLHPSFGGARANSPPPDWVRDGIRPSMARILEFGRDPEVRAFAIVDDDPIAHAEWHNLRQTAPQIAPGERLVLEWNELFSKGLGDTRSATYSKLPAGDYRFRVQEVTALGGPTGLEDSLKIHVPLPLRETPFFWPAVATAFIAASLLTSRYIAWYRMRREVALLRHQRALEQERLRIAQDIHDDLGARVTQIALLSAMAQGNATLPENARAEFNNISRMTRELISALYETVWAVNPENDNLDALGNYLCQMGNELCNQARLRCRFEVMDLPRNIQISSQTRHNITMAVKEGIHKVIKHANAGEVTLQVGFDEEVLTISIRDDGCGFDPSAHASGSGLSNMRRRLVDVGGTCCIRSESGRGTRVDLRLTIKSPRLV
jgi:signal transduction histidine kinase